MIVYFNEITLISIVTFWCDNSIIFVSLDTGFWKSGDKEKKFFGTKYIFVPRNIFCLSSDFQKSVSKLTKIIPKRDTFDQDLHSQAPAQ